MYVCIISYLIIFKQDSKEETKPEEDASQEKYPCGVCIVGSGGGLLKVGIYVYLR